LQCALYRSVKDRAQRPGGMWRTKGLWGGQRARLLAAMEAFATSNTSGDRIPRTDGVALSVLREIASAVRNRYLIQGTRMQFIFICQGSDVDRFRRVNWYPTK